MNPSVGITIGIVRQHTSGRRFHVRRVNWSEQPAITELAVNLVTVQVGLIIRVGVQLTLAPPRTLVALSLGMIPRSATTGKLFYV